MCVVRSQTRQKIVIRSAVGPEVSQWAAGIARARVTKACRAVGHSVLVAEAQGPRDIRHAPARANVASLRYAQMSKETYYKAKETYYKARHTHIRTRTYTRTQAHLRTHTHT